MPSSDNVTAPFFSPPRSQPAYPSGAPESGQYVITQQVRLLYTHVATGLVATMLNAGITVAVLWRTVAPLPLLSWAALLVTITLGRLGLMQAYRRTTLAAGQIRYWRVLFIVGAGCAGMTWGAAGIFLFPDHFLAHQLFLVFVLGGMAAGAIATLSADKF